MKKFCIITNADKDRDFSITSRIERCIAACGLTSYRAIQRDGFPYGFIHTSAIEPGTDCAIVLGGDGTLLHAASGLCGYDIPILGINLGTLGFLAEVEPDNIENAIKRLAGGDFRTEEHMMLHAKCNDSEIDFLNDAVISCSGFSRLIRLQTYVNDTPMQLYSGDGLLIATPTGSTAYNLSAGGPVLSHYSKMMVLTPICPHSLGSRSIVLSEDDCIGIEVEKAKKTQTEEAIVTVDGILLGKLAVGDYLEISKSAKVTRLIRFEKEAFYKALRNKLGWGTN